MKSFKCVSTIILSIVACLFFGQVHAQDLQADNMLLFQRASGGWYKQFRSKSFDYDVKFSATDKVEIADEVKKGAATIDNEATTREIKYLVKAYKKFNNPRYLAAAENGIRYLLKAQYKNGGWPQYYPDRSLYRAEITYNDNAMLNALKVMQNVATKQNDFDVVSSELVEPCANAVNKGIDCILKTQIRVNGKLTAWCQQYDETTLLPAKARAYELPCISAGESVGLVEFLMAQPNTSREIKDAVSAAVKWFEVSKIPGYKFISVPAPGTPKGTNRQLVADSTSVVWARYYDIETNKPFFCDRDGVKKYSIQDIGYERRNGYAWYGTWPLRLLQKDYPDWLKKLK
jgi:PelA/Pel-15E family pectate lyase